MFLLLLLAVNLSGTWKMDASRSESAHQAVPIGPVVIAIRQSPTEIRIETRAKATEVLTYFLNGSERTTTINDSPVKTTAKWEGDKLVTHTERKVNGSSVTTRHVYSLSGNELRIEKTLMVQHGYQFEGAKNYATGVDVFTRVKR